MQNAYTARDHYIQAEVQTATPQKLQLLLVEAAIKNIHRTKHAWNEKRLDVGLEHLAKAQDIVAEILSSLDVNGNPDIAKRLASIYLFIFRRMAEGGMTFEEQKLDDALRILNSERETWKLVCEKFGSTVGQGNDGTTQAASTQASVEYKPTSQPAASSASARLDLSSNAATFAPGVRPLGASPIQTSSSLAMPKPTSPKPTAATSNSPAPGYQSVSSSPTKPTASPKPPVAAPPSTGNNWEV